MPSHLARSVRCLLCCCAVGLSPLACSNDDGRPQKLAAAAPPAPNASLKPATTKMAPTPGTVLRATELKDKPFVDAKTIKKLAPQTSVAVLDRQGGWLQVNAGGQVGWVRLLHVSTQPPGRGGSAREIESAAKIATGRAGSGNIVATSGIRGLNEEQLKNAKPAPEELTKLESYGVSPEQAKDYARKHKLEARKIDYPPEPR